MKGLLMRAREQEEKVIIFYIDCHQHVTQRVVKVLSMNEDNILVYCYYRKKIRRLKMENILSCGPGKKRIA